MTNTLAGSPSAAPQAAASGRDRGGILTAAASVAALAVVSAFGVGYAVGRPRAAPPATIPRWAGTPHPSPTPDVVDEPIRYDLGEAPCEAAPRTPGDQPAPVSPDETTGCTDHGQQFTMYLDGPWVVDEVAFRPDLVLAGRRVVRVHWSFGRGKFSLSQDIRDFDELGARLARVPLPRPGALTSCVSLVVEESALAAEPVGEDSPRPDCFELVGHAAAGPHERSLCHE